MSKTGWEKSPNIHPFFRNCWTLEFQFQVFMRLSSSSTQQGIFRNPLVVSKTADAWDNPKIVITKIESHKMHVACFRTSLEVPSMPAILKSSRRRINLRLPFWTSMLHALSRPDAFILEPPDVDELDGWILVRFQLRSVEIKLPEKVRCVFFFRKMLEANN